MAFLRSILQRINPARPRQSVELHPVAQITVRYLLEFGARSVDDITKEVEATRTIFADEMDESLAHLVEAGLVEAITVDSETRYAATRKAAILRNRIPHDPRGVTEFYL
ncbi:MAG TPA: hypothetical protein VFS30_16185 [Dehalococcoidia bacterium]|nr:hypothetical protein [Dehalococcoidia bacterium]